MGVENLVFKVAEEVIYDPTTVVVGTSKIIQISNMGTETLVDLGLYIKPATNLGELDYPSDYPPDTDYQDVLTWGEEAHQGIELSGGIFVTVAQNSGTFSDYITRTVGNSLRNKIPIQDLPAGATVEAIIDLEIPPGGTPRRLYIDMAVE